MYFQIACQRGFKVTLVPFVWIFSTVYFQMFLQIACQSFVRFHLLLYRQVESTMGSPLVTAVVDFSKGAFAVSLQCERHSFHNDHLKAETLMQIEIKMVEIYFLKVVMLCLAYLQSVKFRALFFFGELYEIYVCKPNFYVIQEPWLCVQGGRKVCSSCKTFRKETFLSFIVFF